jgi:hypothetical protein
MLALAVVVGLVGVSSSSAAHDYSAPSGHVTYRFIGASGNRRIDVSWSARRYLIRSSVGEWLLSDYGPRNRIFVCAPTLKELKAGGWPNAGGALKFCAQYPGTGNNFGLTESVEELAHYFDPRKNYSPAALPIARRSYAGVLANCYRGTDKIDKTSTDTICEARPGGYMTFMKTPKAQWTAIKAVPVDRTQLTVPRGAQLLSLSESAKIIP